MNFHPLADLLPMMTEEEFANLKSSITKVGLLEPITLHPDGRILDGRNRYKACVALGIEPHYTTFDGELNVVSIVEALNLARRHLTQSQKAMIGARIEEAEAEEAKKRMSFAGKNFGQNHPKEGMTILSDPLEDKGRAVDKASSIVGVSPSYISDAKKIVNETPDLADHVRDGRINIPTAKVLAEVPAEQRAEIVARGEKEILAEAKRIKAEKAAEKKAERVEAIQQISANSKPLHVDLERLYPVIYADPPWRYDYSATSNRDIENHYPTMDLSEICALPVADIAAPHSILFMWTTSPKLADSIKVLEAWGFNYTTCFVWVKDKIGMGYHARQRHELLLIAKRGALPVPNTENRFDSVIEYPRTEHSAKPHVVYDMIEQMYPEYEKIELFARNKRDGWQAWGNQA